MKGGDLHRLGEALVSASVDADSTDDLLPHGIPGRTSDRTRTAVRGGTPMILTLVLVGVLLVALVSIFRLLHPPGSPPPVRWPTLDDELSRVDWRWPR
jgi:hypothetical protein